MSNQARIIELNKEKDAYDIVSYIRELTNEEKARYAYITDRLTELMLEDEESDIEIENSSDEEWVPSEDDWEEKDD
jgi:hypothetical protein